jgi:hypothetical protein
VDRIVPIAGSKAEQIREAGRKQLSPEDYQRLDRLLSELRIYGLTPYLNVEIGKLMSKISWELEISESPEWAEALIACDRAFLGDELREMCREVGVGPPRWHKKFGVFQAFNRLVAQKLSQEPGSP